MLWSRPTLRGLRNYTDLAPFQLNLPLILHREKGGTAHQLFWKIEGSVLGWLQSSLWQIFNHCTEWLLESSFPELPSCEPPSLISRQSLSLCFTCHICLEFTYSQALLPHLYWTFLVGNLLILRMKTEMTECAVLSRFWQSSSTYFCWAHRPMRGWNTQIADTCQYLF